jgi:tetratricopeptide (TPR) repeat protein
MIADIYTGKDEHGRTLEWYRDALEWVNGELGQNDPSALVLLCKMASIHFDQHLYHDALELYQMALNGLKQTCKPGDDSVVSVMSNVALTCQIMGRYDQALEAYTSLEHEMNCSAVFNPESQLQVMEHIAGIYSSQGKCDKALDQNMLVYNKKVSFFGKIHPSTLNTINNIAAIHANGGDYRKAINWLQCAVDGYNGMPGTEDGQPGLLDAIQGMATVYCNMGQVDEGLRHLRDAVEKIRQGQSVGHDDITLNTSTLDAMHDPANMCDHVGKEGEALLWYSRTLEGYQKVLGKNHPITRKEAEKLSELKSRVKH